MGPQSARDSALSRSRRIAGSAQEVLNRQATSIQALTSVGNDLVYAGSFGLGLFRSEDRGATWTKSGQGVTDPFILTLTTGKDGAIYAGTFRGGVFRSRDRGKELAGDQ